MRMRLRQAAAFALSILLLAAGDTARAFSVRQDDTAALTPEERREAGEFLLRLDEHWREARDFGVLFDEAFVGDFTEVSRADPDALPFLVMDQSLRGQLTAAEWRRANVTGLDFLYVAGRLYLTFEQVQKNRKAAKRDAAASRQIADGREPQHDDEEDAEPSLEEILSPAVVEEFKKSPLCRSILGRDCGEENAADDGDLEVTTHEQFDALLSTLERAAPKMRARVRELEAELGGAPVSAVPREDEGEGEWPDLSLSSAEAESKNRPAGTRVVVSYVSLLQVLLVKEGGRYKVLAAYQLAD
jgi:hypothetical protein